MANNRVYLYCPDCKESCYLSKCLGDGYGYLGGSVTELGEQFIGFVNKHLRCDDSRGEARQIELRFEHHQDKAREVPPHGR